MKAIDKSAKILLVLMPHWTPLIAPEGISRLKGVLQGNGYNVKTVDLNLDSRLRHLYSMYFEEVKKIIPSDKQGNLNNIGNDVWREHIMAQINFDDYDRFIELIEIIYYQTYFYTLKKVEIDILNDLISKYIDELKIVCEKLLLAEKPVILGVSLFRDTLAASILILQIAKSLFPSIKTIAGGGAFTSQLIIGSPNIDIFQSKTKDFLDKLFVGPSEQLLLEYVQGRLPDNKRIYTKDDIQSKDIDTFTSCVLDTSDFNMDHYNWLTSYNSSSCPNQCSFCNVFQYYGEFKRRPIQHTVKEMIEQNEKHKIQLFHMLDALLNPFIDELSQEFINREESLYYDGYLRVSEETCIEEKAYQWRNGGYYRARLGVESGSQHVLDLMGKTITVEQSKQTLINLASAGIKTTIYIVIGHPEESISDFQKSMDFITEMKEYIWEVECNPFTYLYLGQNDSNNWEKHRKLLYPEWSSDWLYTLTWYLDCQPERQEIFRRINAFKEHCKENGIPSIYSVEDIKLADQRWHSLHVNAVPPLLSFKRNNYISECKEIRKKNNAVVCDFNNLSF